MFRMRTLLAPVAVAPVTASPAVAVTGSSDTASPVYRTDSSANTSNRFACDGFDCDFTITTKTSNFPCTAEVVVLASGQPALLYTNTFCNVSISGTFTFEGGETDPCVISAVQSLKVRFTSGANSAFNGSFDASGFFKPTGVSSNGRVTQAQVTVKGADTLDLNPAGAGSIKARPSRSASLGRASPCASRTRGRTTATSPRSRPTARS